MRRLAVLLFLLLLPAGAMWAALEAPVETPELRARSILEEDPRRRPRVAAQRRSKRASARRRQRRADPIRDPVHRALDGTVTEMAVVHWSAFRRTELGESVLRCIGAGPLAELSQKLGVDDIGERVERFAVQDDLAVFTGDFGGADWAALVEAKPVPYGEHGELYDPGDGHGGALAVWDGRVVLAGPNANAVEAAIDRLEGRARSSRLPILPGHLSGTVPASKLSRQLPLPPGVQRALDEQLEGAQAWFTVTADDGLAIRLELAHHDPSRAEEAQTALLGATRDWLSAFEWLPVRHTDGVFEIEVSGDHLRSLLPCARPTL